MATTAAGLKELHHLHIQLHEVCSGLENGPKRIAASQRFTKLKQDNIDSLKAQLQKLKMSADDKSLQLKTNESKIIELKTKLNAAASNREFEIIKSQIDADVMANSVLEDEILEALDKVDQMQSTVKLAESEHSEAQSKGERAVSEVAEAEPGLTDRQASLAATLKTSETALPGTVLATYRRLVEAHGSGALSPVDGKACEACNAILSPQLLVEVNILKFVFCRSCGRLLYRNNSGNGSSE